MRRMIVSLKIALRVLVFFLIVFPLSLATAEDKFTFKRQQMVEQDIKGRGMTDPTVLGVMEGAEALVRG